METCILVLADYDNSAADNEEFIELIKACEIEIVSTFQQTIKNIQFNTYIGKGKCSEIHDFIQHESVDCIIFNQRLSPLQIRTLENIFMIPVIDRTELILAIFSKRATTQVARLQIESAQLKKALPRLIGSNTHLSRQGASGQNKGSGEKQLELDRRRIKQRIFELNRELKKIENQRATQRRARQSSKLPLVSLVGYTNAGKSTILNQLLRYTNSDTQKEVLEKDMLFATLDTSVRRIDLPYGQSFLLSDTVGFVNHLPHELIEAFHSTLEEVKYADLLLQIVDAGDPEKNTHLQVTMDTLREIHAADIPMLTIYNKCDKYHYTYPSQKGNDLFLSAKDETSIPTLLEAITKQLFTNLHHIDLLLPYPQASLYSSLMQEGKVIKREDQVEGMYLEAIVNDALYKKLNAYILKVYAN